MDLASLMAVSVVTAACSMLSLLLVNDERLTICRLKLVVSYSPLRHPCAGISTRAQGHRTHIVPGACMVKPGFYGHLSRTELTFNIVQRTGGQS